MRERYTDAALLFQHIWWMQLAVVCLAEAHMILLATTVLCSNCIQAVFRSLQTSKNFTRFSVTSNL
jgi:hypothetical protein